MLEPGVGKSRNNTTDILEPCKASGIVRTRYFWSRRLKEDQLEYWLKIWLKAAWRDFRFGQDGAVGIRLIFPSDTIYKTDKIFETIVLKTLAIRQQSTAIERNHFLTIHFLRDRKLRWAQRLPQLLSPPKIGRTYILLWYTQITYQNSPYSGPQNKSQ